MLYTLLKLLHVFAVIVWVGGMVFSQFFLRPAALALEPPQRLRLMHATLQRFFNAVSVAVVLVLGTGLWMIGRVAKENVQAGLDFNMPLGWTVMAALGVLMIAIFGHIRFALFKRLTRAVNASDWTAGAAALANIRLWVNVNMALGVATVAVALLLA